MILSAKAAVAGVAGWPVGHSLSPRLHGFWLDHYGLDGTYIPLPLRPEDFAEALPVLAKIGLKGLNVTLPHKEAAFRLCHRTSPRAQAVQAVNTIVFGPEGEIFGDNTDGYGFLENLRSGAPPGWSFQSGPAVVLGAGGAARGILRALTEAGVPQIILLNRTQARAESLAVGLADCPVLVQPWEEVGKAMDGAGLVVNTPTQGIGGPPPVVGVVLPGPKNPPGWCCGRHPRRATPPSLYPPTRCGLWAG